jgi:TP901 family phage tail tape measure protein
MPDEGMSGKYIEELWVGLKVNLKDFRNGLRQASTMLKNYGAFLDNNGVKFRNYSQNVALATGAMAGFGAIITRTFAQFEQSMANTYSVIGTTVTEMKRLEEYARRMGETTIFKASEAADAMYYLASAGYDANQTMGALQGVLNLAAATQYDLSMTSESVVEVLNAFGIEASGATKVANVFAAAIAKSQATMEKLHDSMKYVAPTAAQLNMSLEETVAALDVLYNAGQAASQAGTYLRQGLARLQAPTNEATVALKKMGLTVEDVNPQYHKLNEIIRTFQKAGAGAIGMGDELADIFDIRAMTSFQILIRQGADELERAQRIITDTNKASEMAKIQINTLHGSWKLLTSALQESAIQIGHILAPTLRFLGETLRETSKAFNHMPPIIKDVVVNALALVTALGALSAPILWLLAKIPAIIAGLGTLSVAMGVTFGWIAAIAAVLGIAFYAYGKYLKANEKVVTALDEANKSASDQVDEFDSLIDKYKELNEKENKSTREKIELRKVIDELKTKYPNYLKNIDLEKSAYEDVAYAIGKSREELKKYLMLKQKQAELSDIEKEMGDITSQLEENRKAEKALRKTIKDKGYEDAIKTEDEFWKRYKEADWKTKQKMGAERKYNKMFGGPINSEAKTLYEQLNKLSEENKKLDEKWEQFYSAYSGTSRQIEIAKGITIAPAGGDNDIQCDPGYHWDYDEQRCVEDIKLTGDDAKKRQDLLYDIEKTGLQNRIELLSAHKDDSLQAELDWIKAKRELEDLEAKHESDQMLEQANELKLTEDQKNKIIEESEKKKVAIADNYASEIFDVKNKWWGEEEKRLKEKGEKDKQIEENKLMYEADLSEEGLMNYRKYLKQRLAELKSSGNEWTDEYLNILDRLTDIDRKTSDKMRNQLLFRANREGESIDKDYGLEDYALGKDTDAEKYAGSLEAYDEYLTAQLELYEAWDDRYVQILEERERVEEDIRRRNLYRTKLGFLSMRQAADILTSSLTSGWNEMFSRWIIGGREAKNDLDAIWLSMKNSFLSTLNEIIMSEITKMFVKLIAKVLDLITGNTGIVSAGANIATGGNVDSYFGSASGSEIRKSGLLKVHQGEMVVPASIVRKTNKDYEKQSKSETDTGANNPIIQNITISIPNATVNDKRYWETAVRENIMPAFEQYKKRTK